MVIFLGTDAYVTPTWYASKREHCRVLQPWNYGAIHASGQLEFFEPGDRLLHAVSRLTDRMSGRVRSLGS